MSKKRPRWPWIGMALLTATGCAPGYHAYPCGCVPYGYCPEPPLPFTNYCTCPTPWAAKFRCQPAAGVENVQEEEPVRGE